jgi:AH receptor-interacting protein
LYFKHTSVYPVVSKTLREYYGEKKSHSHDEKHCCGMMMAEHGVGFDDLNDLMKNPKQLRFTLGWSFFTAIKIK